MKRASQFFCSNRPGKLLKVGVSLVRTCTVGERGDSGQVHLYSTVDMYMYTSKCLQIEKREYRDGIKRKETRLGWCGTKINVCMVHKDSTCMHG